MGWLKSFGVAEVVWIAAVVLDIASYCPGSTVGVSKSKCATNTQDGLKNGAILGTTRGPVFAFANQ